MNEPDFTRRFFELGAGRPMPEIVGLPDREFAEPARPTASAKVHGVQLSPASRLTAIAAIRDAHRAAARAASDRAHDLRERANDAANRVRHLETRAGQSLAVEADMAELAMEIEQLKSARDAALAEAAAASSSAGDADRLLKACLAFARDNAFTLPITLSREARS